MRSRLSPSGIIVLVAATVALVLTVTRPSRESLLSFGVGEREVRAAPGQSAASSKRHDLTKLKVFNLALVRVRDAYVDGRRIDPEKMLFAALDSVQFNVPEVLVEPYPEKDEVVVVVNDKQQRFSTKEVDSPWRLSGKLKKIFRFMEANMNRGADLAQVEYAAVNGMLQTLDPHSVLLDPETAREMDVNTSGKFGGLGIVIRMYERKLTVVRPIKNTPAHRAGLQRGDHIVKIDNEVTENLTLNEAVDRMRGDPDTPVTLMIEREGQKSLLHVPLTRAIIRVESVESHLLSKNVGYLRIKQFSGETAKELRDAMDELRGKGARAWVVDLRWNPGGLLEQAIKVSDLFVDSGTIVTTVGGREREPRRASRKGTDDKSPIAVLVNGNSASASEIVAGALKNLDRAITIGTQTFGKGSVQVLYDNPDGSKLKLTIAEYLTPGDRSIQSVGITPDIQLHRMVVPKKNLAAEHQVRLLASRRSFREKDLESHLESTYASAAEKPVYELGFLYEPPDRSDALIDEDAELYEEEEEPLDDEFHEDFEVKLARDLLASATSADRKGLVRAAKKLVARQHRDQQQKLSQALQTLAVDWSEPPASVTGTARLTASVKLVPDGALKAGTKVDLVGTVTNSGTVPAYQVHIRSTSDNAVFDERELVFGKIEPGQTKTFTTHLETRQNAYDRADRVTFELTEARGARAEIAPLDARVIAAERPVFAYSHQLIDEGNGDGLVQKGERHRLRVRIKNTGAGAAPEPTAILRNASGDGVLLRKARFELGKLDPGQQKDVEFVFDVTDALGAPEAIIEMTVYDGVLGESVMEKLRYNVKADSAGPAPQDGMVKVTSADAVVYEGAASDSSPVAWAERGAVFRAVGQLGPWTKIDLGSGRPGFIASAQLRKVRDNPRARVRTNWQVTPPAIELSSPTYHTRDATYRLRGKARDDSHVEDVYVFVSNFDAKVDNRKVFYKSNRQGTRTDSLDFTPEIPLWPGSNRITVVVRENDDVRSTHTIFVYREPAKTAAK